METQVIEPQHQESDAEKIARLERELAAAQEVIERQNAQLVEITNQRDEAIQLAGKDALTGLPNRRRGLDDMKSALDRQSRGENSLLCYMIDIDYFKQINDTYGHEVGDMVLKTFASIIKHETRGGDTTHRHGGEEFVITLSLPSEVSQAAIQRITDRYTEAARKIDRRTGKCRYEGLDQEFNFNDPAPTDSEGNPFKMIDAEDPVTISIGAVFVRIGTSNVDQNSLLKQMDEAMYTSKRSGRATNTIRTYKPPAR